MKINLENLSTMILRFLTARLPESLAPWGQAMLAEVAVIDSCWARLRWSLGSSFALSRVYLRVAADDLLAYGPRRIDVLMIAVYHMLFTALLFGVLSWQLPHMSTSWVEALLPLILAYGISAVPAVLGLGLALGDDAARVATIIFSICHALLTWKYIHDGISNHLWFSCLRISIDGAIVVILNRRLVRQSFQMSPLILHLNS